MLLLVERDAASFLPTNKLGFLRAQPLTRLRIGNARRRVRPTRSITSAKFIVRKGRASEIPPFVPLSRSRDRQQAEIHFGRRQRGVPVNHLESGDNPEVAALPREIS